MNKVFVIFTLRNIMLLQCFILLSGFCNNVFGQQVQKVVATTLWTAEYVKMAGVEDVTVLAPLSLVHPSEYELQVFDLKQLQNADYLVYGGYEVMVPDLKKVLKNEKLNFLQIKTSYTFNEMEKNILKLAAHFGTTETAIANISSLKTVFDSCRYNVINSGYKDELVAVHFFQQQFAKELNLNIVAVFGPSPLEAYQLIDLRKSGAVYVIDNFHNPISDPLCEILKAKKIVFLNFPGKENTNSIEDVVRYNTRAFCNRLK
jgi:hypothetical protein